MKRKIPLVLAVAAVLGGLAYFGWLRPSRQLVLTGVVTTDEVMAGSEIQGRLRCLNVREGDWVTNGQLVAQLEPQEWAAEVAFYASSREQSAAQMAQSQAELRFQESQTTNQIRQAEASLAAAQAQVMQGEAELEIAELNWKREKGLFDKGVDPLQVLDQTRTSRDALQAKVESLRKQALAAQAAVALAQANQEQVGVRQAGLNASTHELAAVAAQQDRAKVRLDYTEIRAPIAGLVDVRAALAGEVVSPGQTVVTLIDPDNLWVRADVEESFIERVRLGDELQVRLPSGEQRPGKVFYRRADADYATQRDVSRAKRDIKTFEIRLRCDNQDRRLAVGMTAYVSLPLAPGTTNAPAGRTAATH